MKSCLDIFHSIQREDFFLCTVRFLHLTATSQKQVNNTNPCKMKKKKTESRKDHCPCIGLCVPISPFEKPLIHAGLLPISSTDAAETAKTFVPVCQHDHSYFCQEGPETLEAAASQTKIKCYIMTSQSGVNANYKCVAP